MDVRKREKLAEESISLNESTSAIALRDGLSKSSKNAWIGVDHVGGGHSRRSHHDLFECKETETSGEG